MTPLGFIHILHILIKGDKMKKFILINCILRYKSIVMTIGGFGISRQTWWTENKRKSRIQFHKF